MQDYPSDTIFHGRSAALRRELLHESEVEERQADRSHEPTERVDHHQNFIGQLSRRTPNTPKRFGWYK